MLSHKDRLSVTVIHSETCNCGFGDLLYWNIVLHHESSIDASFWPSAGFSCSSWKGLKNLLVIFLHWIISGVSVIWGPPSTEGPCSGCSVWDLWIGPSTNWPRVGCPDNIGAGDIHLALWREARRNFHLRKNIVKANLFCFFVDFPVFSQHLIAHRDFYL